MTTSSCPTCDAAPDRRSGWRWFAPAVVVAGWVFVGAESLRAILAPVLAVYIGAYLSIVLHEIAHAGAAVISNRRVRRVTVGTIGSPYRFAIGSTEIELRSVPDVGLTEVERDDDQVVSDVLSIILGLVVHFGLLAVAGWIAQSFEAFYDLRAWVFGVLYGLLLQLAPRRVDGRPTVGRQIVLLIGRVPRRIGASWSHRREERQRARAEAAQKAADEAAKLERERRETEAVETLDLAAVDATLTSEPHVLLEAKATLESMIVDPPADMPLSIVQNDLARVLLALGEDREGGRTLELTEQALDERPLDPAIQATRGAALVNAGSHDEGFTVLSNALDLRSDGFASAFLALAAIRLGRLDIARSSARTAFEAGVRVWALRAAMPRIGRAEATMLVEGFGCGRRRMEEAVGAVVEAHGDLSVSIGRAARSWIDHASSSERHVFQSEVACELSVVRACADMLARGANPEDGEATQAQQETAAAVAS